MALTEHHRQELEDKGYTVIEDVLTDTECKDYIGQYKEWLSSNFADGEFPHSAHSLVRLYAIGHLDPTWSVRLKSRDVFAQLWGTNRLLSSVDAVAIGRPPEDGEETFDDGLTSGWLHLDQSSGRQGLHAFQGAVYLEDADQDDWTFEVVEGSHRFFDEYYDTHPEQQKRELFRGHRGVKDEYMDYMNSRGCVQKRVPVPRGGMVLWDSRLIHANARPIKGRANPGRWRWAVIVCMAPACWATRKAVETKRQAYRDRHMTTHWPCQEVGIMNLRIPSYAAKELRPLEKLPEVARTVEAQRLAGALPYPEAKGKVKDEELSLMARAPKWHPLFPPDELGEMGRGRGFAACFYGNKGQVGVFSVLMGAALIATLLLAACVFGNGM